MDGEVRFYVRNVIRRLCKWKHLTIIQGNVQKDHVILVEMPPDQGVNFVVGFLKRPECNKDVRPSQESPQKILGHSSLVDQLFRKRIVGVNEEQAVKYGCHSRRKTVSMTNKEIVQHALK